MALDKIIIHQTSLEQDFQLSQQVTQDSSCSQLTTVVHYIEDIIIQITMLTNYQNVIFNHLLNMSPDLTTYDTVKHLLLGHTSLQDNWVTHTISR